MTTNYTDDWLKERITHWQKLLRLEDWRIGSAWCDHWQVGSNWHGSVPLAEVEVDTRHKHGFIRVLRPEQRQPVDDLDSVDPLHDDIETSVVHELLHVSLAEQDEAVPEDIDRPGSPFWLGQERHIVNLSKALVTLDRQGRVIPTESPQGGGTTGG